MSNKKKDINHSLPISHSQNYLINKRLIDKLIQQSNIHPSDEVLDIGAGKGAITASLLSIGCKVRAIELDRKNVIFLEKKFQNEERCTIISGDFITLSLPDDGKYKIFSNIPFFITSDIVSKITETKNPPNDAYLIVQKQAALKYSGIKNTSQKSLLLKPKFDITIVYHFSQNDFSPRPNVDVVLLHIKKRSDGQLTIRNYELYCDFICYCFQNGKTFSKKIFSYKQLKELRKRNGITDYQVSKLEYEKWISLFECFLHYASDEKKLQVKGAYKRYLLQESQLQKKFRGRK